jgi:hypothetical protein
MAADRSPSADAIESDADALAFGGCARGEAA